MRVTVMLLAILCWPGSGWAQRPARRPPSPAAARAQPERRYKGIWEPVNYMEDVSLNDVYFVTPDDGWVSGGPGGVLLHTVDGGEHWEVALGDPTGSQRAFSDLRFVDQATGFAVQSTGVGDHSLLRTTDGNHWIVSGTVPQHRGDYRFFSGTVGVASRGNEIDRTTDAGRSWKKVFDCALRVEVQGLTREVHCEVAAFSFPSATVGYAIGNASAAPGLFVFRTDDQGATWTGWFAGGNQSGREGHLFFTTETTGYACIGGLMFGTTDGGKTWTGLPGGDFPGKPRILFADPEVGWTYRYNSLSYSVDGGARWVTRDVKLPASVIAFSLPRRDRAYAVGDHGMIYRYRVVPVETVVVKAVDAPAMPGIPMTLATDVAQLDGQVTALDGFVQSAADVPAAGAGGPATVGAASGAASSGGDFAQSPPSAFVTGCCGKRLSALELILKAVGGIVPDFLSKFKNLNLLAQGLRTAAALPEMSDSLRTAFKSFRTASDRPTAAAALSGLKGILASLKAAVDTAMQNRKTQPGGQ